MRNTIHDRKLKLIKKLEAEIKFVGNTKDGDEIETEYFHYLREVKAKLIKQF